MKNPGLLRKMFLFWVEVASKYERINSDPEKRDNDVSLGITSLTMSIIGTAMAVAFAYFAFKCFTWTADGTSSVAAGFGGIFVIIGGIICAIIAVASFVDMLIASLLYAHYQRKLNDRSIGTIALIVGLILTVGAIAAVILLVLFLK